MLTSIHITDYGLVAQLDIEFRRGMTAITGETGAGKSLVIDALGMALGDRGDIGRIRAGAERSEVAAGFDVAANARALAWLAAQDYPADTECLLRRVFTRDGRSRGYINGRTATMQQLQELGELLIDIHSQHEHQSLLRRETHAQLLDDYGQHGQYLKATADTYAGWWRCNDQLRAYETDQESATARRELLAFQVGELDRLAPTPGEAAALDREHRLLANADRLLDHCHQLLALGGEGEGQGEPDLAALLHRAEALARDLHASSAQLQSCVDLFDSARIQVEEALREVAAFAASVESDPARLEAVEARLAAYHRLAKRHQVAVDELAEFHQQLRAELDALESPEQSLQALRAERDRWATDYAAAATALGEARRDAASRFTLQVNARLADLGLGAARVEFALPPRADERPHPGGRETPELRVASNPGQPPRPLAKVASGGELSRISLAIQVVAAEKNRVPAMVFDEVDVGVGGATAAIIGQLLRQLGGKGQVIAITHLPQVASHAHQHLVVTKTTTGSDTTTALQALAAGERVDEIARMLGGARITAKTVAHARDLLTQATTE